jgi:hypothetical protein
MGLSFTNAAGPRQRSHSWIRVQRGSWPYFAVSDLSLPHPGGPGSHIYIPQNRVAQLYPQVPGSLFVTSYDLHSYGGGIWTCLHMGYWLSPVRVRVILRMAVYCPSVHFGYKPLETHDQQFFFSTKHLVLALTSVVILRSKSCGLITFYCLRFETPLAWRARSPYLYPWEQGGPVIPPGTKFPSLCLIRLAGLQWRYSTPLPHREFSLTKL